MTLPVTNSTADVYNDLAGLTALKKSARSNDPEALRQVAKQYESLFARMMIKSMREAIGKDPLFGSDEGQSYQEMYDDQLSIELTKGKGLGLADLLVRQMQRLTGGGPTDASGATGSSSAAGSGSATAAGTAAGSALPAQARRALRLFRENGSPDRSADPIAASPQTQDNFIRDLWPAAQRAGQVLGVDPRNLIAQAALETNWGTRVPHDPSGHSSNNLFGMKASSQWTGSSVSAATQEYEHGAPAAGTGQFRAYDTPEQSVQDYVALLRSSPRYAAALNTGGDIRAFATALQRGGYATDPNYATKITAVAAQIQPPAAPEPSLKSASALPITPDVETL